MRKFLFLALFFSLLFSGLKGSCAGKFTVNGICFPYAQIIPDDSAPDGDFQTLVVPIKRAGNLIIVEAQLDSLEGNNVMDNGAPYLVLNATYFRDAPHVDEQQ